MRCTSKTSGGQQCKARSLRNSTQCFFHTADGAKRAGQLGGRKRICDTARLGDPNFLGSLRKTLARTVSEIRAGKVDTRIANAAAYACSVLAKVIEMDETAVEVVALKAEVAAIRKQVADVLKERTHGSR